MKQKGFTLIELLVVIAIVGLLASIVLVALKGARTKAQATKVTADIQEIIKGLELARDKQNNYSGAILGTYYDANSYCSGKDLRHLAPTDTCLTTMSSYFQQLGFANTPTDPWGSPYLLELSEYVGGGCNGHVNFRGTHHDVISSPGPDGLMYTGDDIWSDVPYFICP